MHKDEKDSISPDEQEAYNDFKRGLNKNSWQGILF